MQSLEKFEQSVYIDECILTFCSFFDDHLKRFSNVFIFSMWVCVIGCFGLLKFRSVYICLLCVTLLKLFGA